MIALNSINLVTNFIKNFKNLYGPFWKTVEELHEYYLKLDGYYYSKKQKCIFVVIRIRNKRFIEKVQLNKIINDKEYLKELHPVDACIIGILANNERNGLIDTTNISWQKTPRLKECNCFIKNEKILEDSKKYTNHCGISIIELHSKLLNKKIELSIKELCENQALLTAIDSFQAIAIGYDASELLARKNLLNR